MEKELWEILKALDDKKLTAIEAHKKLCGLYINGVVFNEAEAYVPTDWECQKQCDCTDKNDCTGQNKVELCECGVNERVGLDCTMKPCNHLKYYKGKHN